ncbi:MAG: response regulator transcription factor [Proteobacteria bacterium]|nr:response regulator transcription factor [Pseudomonadota bacterium]
MKILLIEDDQETADYIIQGLQGEGHVLVAARDGQAGLVNAAGEDWDLLIVDRMLPKLDGLGMVRLLRGSGVNTPVLFLTALGGIDDRVAGLNAGGDDYLVKPFAFSEFVARINALRRRPHHSVPETTLKIADLEIDLQAHVTRRGGKVIDLQPREFRLLEYLMRHAGQVITRTMLLENVWHMHFDPHTNVVESHISRLRSKMAQDGSPELIHTIRGAGYCLRAPI